MVLSFSFRRASLYSLLTIVTILGASCNRGRLNVAKALDASAKGNETSETETDNSVPYDPTFDPNYNYTIPAELVLPRATSLIPSPSVSETRVTGSNYTTATRCGGTNTGGYCSTPYYVRILFDSPFAKPPVVHVSPANISDHGGDIRGTMDSVVALAADISATGFTLVCAGSPNPNSSASGPYEGQWGKGSCSWTAIGQASAPSAPNSIQNNLRVFSRDTITGASCSGTYVGGYCVGGYYFKDILFDRTFAAPPTVVVSPSMISDQAGNVGYATDKIVSYASNVTTSGARIWCSGSQIGLLGAPYETAGTVGTCDAIAFGDSGESFQSGDIRPEEVLVQAESSAEAMTCDGALFNTFCHGGFYQQITFGRRFGRAPIVQATPARNSTHPGTGNATDQVRSYVTEVTATGFKLWCSGSPINGPHDGLVSRSSCNWLAVGVQ